MVLEIYNSVTEELEGRFDFTIVRTYGEDDDGGFWLDTDEVRFAIRKAGLTPTNCGYRVVCDCAPGEPAVAGWRNTTFRSTDGFTTHAVGTGITAGSVGVGLAYYTRTR